MGRGDGGIDAGGGHVPEDEISLGRTRVAAIEGEGPAGVASLAEVVRTEADVHYRLHEVLAALIGDLVDELVDPVGTIARPDGPLQVEDAKYPLRAADGYVGRAEELRIGGGEGNAHLVCDVEGRVARRPELLELLEVLMAVAELVDQHGREDMGLRDDIVVGERIVVVLIVAPECAAV